MSGNPYEPPAETQSRFSKPIDYAGIWSFIATMIQPPLFWSFSAFELSDVSGGLLLIQYILMVASGMVLGFNSTIRTLNGKRLAYFPLGLIGFSMSFVCVFGFPLLGRLI